MTHYKTNHYHKSANSHEHNEHYGKVITQYTDPETDVLVLWETYMPHQHKFWTQTSYTSSIRDGFNDYKLHTANRT
jgi:hypothetical protein